MTLKEELKQTEEELEIAREWLKCAEPNSMEEVHYTERVSELEHHVKQLKILLEARRIRI